MSRAPSSSWARAFPFPGDTASHKEVSPAVSAPPVGDQLVARPAAIIAPMFSGEKNAAGEIVPAFIWTKPSIAV